MEKDGKDYKCHREKVQGSKKKDKAYGVFSDRTSMERILYAVFTYENEEEGVVHVFMV